MQQVVNALMNNEVFVITSHTSPDGDNAGSCIGLVKFLKKMGKKAYYVLDDYFPQNLSFIYNTEKIYSSDEIKSIIKSDKYVLAALDCGDIKRLEIDENIIRNSSLLLNIDHHKSNDLFGDINYVKDDASSTCELVYNILEEIDSSLIDYDIAMALYTGLVTDTGNFMYESASESSFLMAAELIGKGIDKQKIVRNIYQSDSFNYVKLVSDVTATLEKQGKIAHMLLEQEMLRKHDVNYSDTESLVNIAINIDEVEVGILFKEKEKNLIKVSFRSKQWANVNEIAKQFGGGGHERAAGCSIDATMQEAVVMVLDHAREYMKLHGRDN